MDLGDEGSSPWGDVPSRSNSNQNVPKASTEDSSQISETLGPSKPQSSASTRSPAGGRGGPRVKRYGTQPTRLEAVDDPLGPLGASADSLGGPPSTASADEPPAPPQKEQRPAPPPPGGPTGGGQQAQQRGAGAGAGSSVAASQGSLRSMMDSVNLDDEEEEEGAGAGRRAPGPRVPPPVQPPASGDTAAQTRRQTQLSVSVEQAAKPSFTIEVGDPHKVGDLTSSHTEYSVRTKTTSKAYRNPEFVVSRRYRDFLWLYTQLHNSNPGVIIPPPPEKQAVGRFEADFVESRRAALERMLNKTAAHPMLQHDSDLKLFLESEAFNVDIKNKERRDPGLGESKGMFGAIGISVGSGGKFIEHDDWFHDRKVYLDALENQLKALMKACDTVIGQRKSLAESCSELSASLHSLSAVELSPALSAPLASLSDVQLRARDLYDRQAAQDSLTLGIVVDEYIRLVGSVKTAFAQRQKAYHAWQAADGELQKRRTTQDKLLRQGRSQQDRLNQLGADVADAERRVHSARLLFEDMGRLMRAELERFEREKVEDFKSGVETFLESAVEAQKELIEIWETFLMQLDADAAHFDAAAASEAETGNLPTAASQQPPSSNPTAATAPPATSSPTTNDDGHDDADNGANDSESGKTGGAAAKTPPPARDGGATVAAAAGMEGEEGAGDGPERGRSE